MLTPSHSLKKSFSLRNHCKLSVDMVETLYHIDLDLFRSNFQNELFIWCLFGPLFVIMLHSLSALLTSLSPTKPYKIGTKIDLFIL